MGGGGAKLGTGADGGQGLGELSTSAAWEGRGSWGPKETEGRPSPREEAGGGQGQGPSVGTRRPRLMAQARREGQADSCLRPTCQRPRPTLA